MGRRVKKSVYVYTSSAWQLDKEILFVYDGWNLVEELITDNGTPTTNYYVWGLDLSQSLQGAGGVGGLLAVVDGNNTYHYCYDGNGNVGQLVKASDGSISAQYQYDPFGKLLYSSGPKADENTFRHSTKYYDSETGLLYYGFRFYDPLLGRWITRDPVEEEGGVNLYLAIANDPINLIDLLGMRYGGTSLGEINWAKTVNIATGIFVGYEIKASLETDGCCFTLDCKGAVEIGVGFKRRRETKVKVLGLGFRVGYNVEFSLARNETSANFSIIYCPNRGSALQDPKFYLIDLTIGPRFGVGVFGGLYFGRYISIDAVGNLSGEFAGNFKLGMELVEYNRGAIEGYAIGAATFDVKISGKLALEGNVGGYRFSPEDYTIFDFKDYSLIGGPAGFKEERLGRLFTVYY